MFCRASTHEDAEAETEQDDERHFEDVVSNEEEVELAETVTQVDLIKVLTSHTCLKSFHFNRFLKRIYFLSFSHISDVLLPQCYVIDRRDF